MEDVCDALANPISDLSFQYEEWMSTGTFLREDVDTVICIACLEEVIETQSIKCANGQVYCSTCIARYVRLWATDFRCSAPQCCGEAIDIADSAQFFDQVLILDICKRLEVEAVSSCVGGKELNSEEDQEFVRESKAKGEL